MTEIRRLPHSSYVCISSSGADDWIMRPAQGRKGIQSFGVSPFGTVWFFTRERAVVIYDLKTRALLSRIEVPTGKGYKDTPSLEDHTYGILVSRDARFLYILIRNYIYSQELMVVSVEAQKQVALYSDLPGGSETGGVALADSGHLLTSSSIKNEGPFYTPGVAQIDPATGQCETSVCKDFSHASGQLHSPSPSGRYWIRTDNARLPVIADKPTLRQRFGLAGVPRRGFFGQAVEIWEAFPLQLVRSVVPTWTEMPGPTVTVKDGDRSVEKASIYREISKNLESDPLATLGSTIFREQWQDRDYYNAIIEPVSDGIEKRAREEREAYWQTDEQAFWLRRGNAVVCVGIDGGVSPPLELARAQYNEEQQRRPMGTLLRSITPLVDRRADLICHGGIATVSGQPEPEARAIKLVAEADDHWRDLPVDANAEADAKHVKKLDAMAKKRAKYEVPLASMDEADCIAAIDALTEMIGPDIGTRAYDGQIQAIFKIDRKRLSEKAFFGHVSASCPSAGGAVARLIEAYCDHVPPYADLSWNPDERIGVFSYPAYCLATLAPENIDLLRRFAQPIDTSHEDFFIGQILPLMMNHLGESEALLDLAEWAFLNKLGNCESAGSFWRNTSMNRVARALYTSEGYAERLTRYCEPWPEKRPDKPQYGHGMFDALHRDIAKDLNDWEKAMFSGLQRHILVGDPTTQ